MGENLVLAPGGNTSSSGGRCDQTGNGSLMTKTMAQKEKVA